VGKRARVLRYASPSEVIRKGGGVAANKTHIRSARGVGSNKVSLAGGRKGSRRKRVFFEKRTMVGHSRTGVSLASAAAKSGDRV